MNDRLGEGAAAAGALADELRRRLYLFVRDQRSPVSREQAASATGISAKLAAFHLDKLVARGLLEFHYARPPGRTGRGAGRPAKLYERSSLQVDVTIPERHYDLIGELLVNAIEDQRRGESARDAAVRVSEAAGQRAGDEIHGGRGVRQRGRQRALATAEEVLGRLGYEPYRDEGLVLLRNCPFHVLAQRAPDLVCEMNRAYIEGLVHGLGSGSPTVALDRSPGRCCVTLTGGRRTG